MTEGSLEPLRQNYLANGSDGRSHYRRKLERSEESHHGGRTQWVFDTAVKGSRLESEVCKLPKPRTGRSTPSRY